MQSRRALLLRLLAAFIVFWVGWPVRAQAPPSVAWTQVPTVVVLSPPGDARLPLVHDALAYWNRTFAELGSAFRLGAITEASVAMPREELYSLSEATLQRTGPVPMPDAVRAAPGNIVVVLASGDFISFARRWPEEAKALVAIRSDRFYPLTLPNVARNLIAHELGHAIALRHNSDPEMLMCGRPASCRPDAFASRDEHYFPLTAGEREFLLRLYPADWRPH